MNRRDFLRRAGVAIAAAGIDPELLIWRPRQMIAVPALKRWTWDAGTVERFAWVLVTPQPDGTFERRLVERGEVLYAGEGKQLEINGAPVFRMDYLGDGQPFRVIDRQYFRRTR